MNKHIIKTWIIFVLFSSLVYTQELPPIKLDYSSYALSSDGKVIGYFGNQRRVEVRNITSISKYVTWCLIATEDREFYDHDGVSIKGLVRGILKTISGSTQGGSTITMQLARNLFLTHEQTLGRKINEIELARRLEKRYSKDQILLLYLNTVYFGHSSYGIWTASQEYFQKTPDKLNITESAVLVGLLQSPSGYDPSKNPEKLLRRRNEVLDNLVEVGKISKTEFRQLSKTPLGLNLRENTGRHFLEHIRKEAIAILKDKGLQLSNDQLKITTTLDYRLQTAAEKNIKQQWLTVPASMKDMQIGLVSVEPGSGNIKAMVGGNPESESRGLNRATQIKRQPGSAFKAFLYGELLKEGFTLATPLLDSAIVIDENKITEWRPSNSDDTYSGKYIPLINAVQNSVNLAAAYAITRITKPDSVILFARLCGIKSDIPSYPSIALGTSEVTPLEMAAGYAVFASPGIYNQPRSILKIEDKNGKQIFRSVDRPEYVIDSADCYLITRALQSVTESGTASVIKKYFKGFSAGKTGTTQNSTDVWFVGFNSNLSTAIWMGYDSPKNKLKGGFQYGGTACAPLWGKIMNDYQGNRAGLKMSYPVPSEIDEINLCVETGERATENCSDKKRYPVNKIKMPSYCKKHPLPERYELHYAF